MDGLTAFGVVSVSAMLLFYVLEPRSQRFIVAFALACWSAGLYGWLAGAWPFAVIEGVWGFVALGQDRRRR